MDGSRPNSKERCLETMGVSTQIKIGFGARSLGNGSIQMRSQQAILFPWMHGQDTMDAIFGQTQPAELFSPKNGLLISKKVEKYFDSGKIVLDRGAKWIFRDGSTMSHGDTRFGSSIRAGKC
jgi:hypothetical protein